ncbi:hypothetical protein Tco_0784184 [Tanacetum coccineum]
MLVHTFRLFIIARDILCHGRTLLACFSIGVYKFDDDNMNPDDDYTQAVVDQIMEVKYVLRGMLHPDPEQRCLRIILWSIWRMVEAGNLTILRLFTAVYALCVTHVADVPMVEREILGVENEDLEARFPLLFFLFQL